MANGLRLFTNRNQNGDIVDPISDAGQDGGRPGDPFLDDNVFQGDKGDVKFTRIFLHNESSDFIYSDIRVDAIDRDPSGQLPLEISDSFTVQKPGGSTIEIPSSMVGENRMQFYYEPNLTAIPEDPLTYKELVEPDDIDVNGAPDDTRVLYVMMVIEPNTPTAVFDDISPRVRAVESVPTT